MSHQVRPQRAICYGDVVVQVSIEQLPNGDTRVYADSMAAKWGILTMPSARYTITGVTRCSDYVATVLIDQSMELGSEFPILSMECTIEVTGGENRKIECSQNK